LPGLRSAPCLRFHRGPCHGGRGDSVLFPPVMRPCSERRTCPCTELPVRWDQAHPVRTCPKGGVGGRREGLFLVIRLTLPHPQSEPAQVDRQALEQRVRFLDRADHAALLAGRRAAQQRDRAAVAARAVDFLQNALSAVRVSTGSRRDGVRRGPAQPSRRRHHLPQNACNTKRALAGFSPMRRAVYGHHSVPNGT
jgi:hypothetical protein